MSHKLVSSWPLLKGNPNPRSLLLPQHYLKEKTEGSLLLPQDYLKGKTEGGIIIAQQVELVIVFFKPKWMLGPDKID